MLQTSREINKHASKVYAVRIVLEYIKHSVKFQDDHKQHMAELQSSVKKPSEQPH